jgi:GNAT superfamily N-acetyltransferase
MDLKDLTDLNEKRRAVRPLLSPTDAGDGMASYYALWHDPRRTQLTVHTAPEHHVDGFCVVAQTGVDLFRPLVTLRAPNVRAAGELLRTALVPGRAYYLAIPVTQASAARTFMEIDDPTLNTLYVLSPAAFRPIVNVLVQRVDSPDGAPRFEIRSQGELMALAGTNWRSPAFAEVFVYTHPEARGRGWGQSVVSACTAALLEEGLRPLYVVAEGNDASAHVARALGYVDSGLRELTGEGRLKVEG